MIAHRILVFFDGYLIKDVETSRTNIHELEKAIAGKHCMNFLLFTRKPLDSAAVDWIITLISVWAFSTLILLAAGAPSENAYYHIFLCAFGSWVKFGHCVKAWIPLTLCACGLLYTFRIGLWNIGIESRMIKGAVFATGVLRPGVGTENEILLLRLVFGPWKQPGVASMSGTETFPPALWLSQVAVRFVLTLMTRDLAYFIGNPYSRIHGPQVLPLPIPFLKDIPFIGPILFQHNITVYASLIVIGLSWWYLYHTSQGLKLRSVGENPAASHARGIHPHHLQTLYAICGGILVGLSGAVFSLSAKPGWGRPQGAEGTGWIALALVIFGGWNPVKAAAGAYLFALLQVMGIYFQGWFPSIPAQVFQTAPFPLMILILVLMFASQQESVMIRVHNRPWLKSALGFFSSSAPTALGKSFHQQ